MKVSMLLLAAGSGTRLGGDVPKPYLPCRGRSLLLRSADRLRQVADPRAGEAEIVLVCDPERHASHLDPLRDELAALGVGKIVAGGASRQESMALGLEASNPSALLVLIHDAARALFPVAAARQALVLAERDGAALLATPLADTLKEVDDHGRVLRTVERRGVWQAQTPQVARRDLLLGALDRARSDGFAGTDDVSLLEHAGLPVRVVLGTRANIKITHPEDLTMAEALLAAEEGAS